MPDLLSGVHQKITGFWGEMSKAQRGRLFLLSIILILAISTSIFLATRTEYVPLISGADTKEIGEMVKILEENNLKFKISQDNRSIEIESSDNNAAQAALVQSGYPKSSGMTFDDAFNKIKINTTESDKKKLWEEYKAKSLSTKLKMLDNVEDADVSLAMPEQSLFITGKDQQKPTANVLVKTYEELTPKQVEGIIKLVASSVENLNPKDVTVVDNNGNILSPEAQTAESGSILQYEMTLKKKRELEKNIRDMFNGQFQNFEGIRVAVNPVLDFNKSRTVSNDILRPEGMDGGAIISRHEATENIENGALDQGAPGMDSNPGNIATYQTDNNANSNYNKSDITENFDYSKVQKEEEKAVGSVIPEETSGAITLLYGNKVKDNSGLTPEFLQEVKFIASSATGIPVENISVTTLRLEQAEVVPPVFGEKAKDFVDDYGIMILLLILTLGLVAAIISSAAPSRTTDLAVEQVASSDGSTFSVSTADFQESILGNDRRGMELPEISVDEGSEVKRHIESFVKQKPEAAAQLLRNWLTED